MKDRDVERRRRRYRVEVEGRTGYTLDVSLGGFAAELPVHLRAGSEVRGNISVGEGRYGFSARVVWAREGRVGLRFRGVENAYLQSLSAPASNPL